MNRSTANFVLGLLSLLPFTALADCNRSWVKDNTQTNNEEIKKFEQVFSQGKQGYVSVEQRMQLFRVPGMSVAVVKNGQLVWTKSYGVKQAQTEDCVDINTVYSVGSISKVAAALMTLKLTQQGKLDLDRNVNKYLSGWQVPTNKYTKNTAVTLRHLLSHSAGFNVQGFNNYQPNEALPNTMQILLGQSPAKNQAVSVVAEPGTEFRYSGGGTMVQQLVIEQTTKQSFSKAADALLFGELKMRRSSFINPLPAEFGNVAKAHNQYGELTAQPRGWEAMPEQAAAGLWTSALDLGIMLEAIFNSYYLGENPFLNGTLSKDMMTPENNSRHGLGPKLNGEVFSHGGANDSYRAYFQGNLASGHGFVILTNSSSGISMIKEVQDTMKRLGLG